MSTRAAESLPVPPRASVHDLTKKAADHTAGLLRSHHLAPFCDLSVYRYRSVPTWRVIRLDTTLYVSAFDAGWEGHESATYEVMETPHGPLYRGFRRMFDALLGEAEQGIWQGGRPVIEAESWPASRTRKP